jgi:flagellar basal body-associated protein FliL
MNAEAPNPRPSSTSQDGVFSLEDLDKIIEAEDPNFKSEMENIKSTKLEDTTAVESLQVLSDDDLVKDEESEKKIKQKIIAFFVRPWRRFAQFLKLKKIAIQHQLSSFLNGSKNFLRHELPDRLRYLKSRTIAGYHWCVGQWKRFLALSRLQKAALVGTVIFGLFSLLLLSRTLTGAWLPSYNDPLPRSLMQKASFTGKYESQKDMQLLFEAFPEVEFNVLLNKVIVNLRPDEESTNNPMGTFEFYVAVDSQDTAVEVKDREREILDIIQRTAEDFTYTQVRSELGKSLMKSAIRDRLNQVLNQGQVMRLYFNTIIITP